MSASDEAMRVAWQMAGGTPHRSYADVFLRYGVALIGPGDAGRWHTERDDAEFGGSQVRLFADEMEVEDPILLRAGNSRVIAIGLVTSDYVYLEQFDDVKGLDLQHARRVRWFGLPEGHDFGRAVFAGPRFGRVSDPEALDYLRRMLNAPPTRWQTAPLPALPEEEPALQRVPERLQGIVGKVQDLAVLMTDRERFGDRPAEAELVAHCVVPFLIALGWLPELVAVEWQNIDVIVFDRLPRTPENCRFVVEAKRLGQGVEGALDQARGYLEAIGVDRDVVVTDGMRYRMFDSSADFAPSAYANLTRLKASATQLFDRMMKP